MIIGLAAPGSHMHLAMFKDQAQLPADVSFSWSQVHVVWTALLVSQGSKDNAQYSTNQHVAGYGLTPSNQYRVGVIQRLRDIM